MHSHSLIDNIHTTLCRADQRARKTLNMELIKSNWEVGKLITESSTESDLNKLSESLRSTYGLTLQSEDLKLYKEFFNQHPIQDKISLALSWAHYLILMSISDVTARAFYQWQTEKEQWEPQQLKTHIQQELFEQFKADRRGRTDFNIPQKTASAKDRQHSLCDSNLIDFLRRFQAVPSNDK